MLGDRRGGQALFVFAVLWSFSRAYSGLFYPSDDLASAPIGAAVGCLVTLGLRVIGPVPTRVLKGTGYLHPA